MLCVGIVRHGYGAWVPIRDDQDLGLTDKFFLEENRVEKKEERKMVVGDEKTHITKSPGAVHLVRRADYLLSVLKEKTSNGTNLAAKRAVENHHRNNKKNGLSHKASESRATVSASPAPASARKGHREPEKHRPRPSNERHVSNDDHGSHDKRPRTGSEHLQVSSSSHHRRRSNEATHPGSNDNAKNRLLIKMVFTPVNASLEKVKRATKEFVPSKDQRAAVLRDELLAIGHFVKSVVGKDNEASDSMEADLW